MEGDTLRQSGIGWVCSLLTRFLMVAILAISSHMAVEVHLDDLEMPTHPARPSAHSEYPLVKGASSRPLAGVSDSGKSETFSASSHQVFELGSNSNLLILNGPACCEGTRWLDANRALASAVIRSGGARDPPSA
jgi:hypothetical protein